METIILLEGNDLEGFLGRLDGEALAFPIYSLRLCVDGNQVKVKVNGGTWSYGLGQLDPMCQTAQRRTYCDES